MVAKINVGSSLYGALAYNGEKINEGQGRLLATHKIFDEGTGRLDIRQAAEDFARYLPEQVRTSKPVVHISLNPHPDDRLTDTELTAIAEEYLARLGYGDQPYAVFKHEDIDRHHLHIVTLCVDERSAIASSTAEARTLPARWSSSTGCIPPSASGRCSTNRLGVWMLRQAT